jgi:DnaJ-class molecular chaperone
MRVHRELLKSHCFLVGVSFALKKSMLTAYEVFNLSSNFNPLELRRAYRSRMRLLHPDLFGDEVLELFFELEQAYRILSQTGLRKAFAELKMFNPRLSLSRAIEPPTARALDNFHRIQKRMQ